MSSEKGSVSDFARIVSELLPGVHRPLIIYTIAAAVYELCKLVPVYLVKLIVDNIFGTPDFQYLLLLGGGVFLTLLVLTLIELAFIAYMANLAARQQQAMLERSFNKLMSLPLSWHEKQNTGSLISKLTKAGSNVNQLLWFISDNIIPILLQLVLTGIVLLWNDWRIGLLYVLFTPFVLLLLNKQGRDIQPLRQRYHHEYDEATREFAQSLYNVQTVKDYVQEKREATKHSGYLGAYVSILSDRAKHEFRSISTREMIVNVVRVVTLVMVIRFVLDGTMTPGDLVFVFTLTEKAYINLHRLGRVYSFMGDSHEALDRALMVQQAKNTLPDNGTKKPQNGDIALSRVDFDYGREGVLHDVSTVLKKGKVTAIVGPSGGGKTTMVRLITRQYDPSSGTITLAGTDLREIPLRELRTKIAFVSQHTEIFDRTVAENIAYARPDASRADIVKAAKQANAHEFISKFTDGYDTMVGEKGVRLSGGQRQRISIARALLANPDIIIFDEATSSLDSESERTIQQAVFSIKGKTLIIIAHRFSTIEHADQIVVLKDGKIVETGTHRDLVRKKGGIYKRMRALQALGELRK